MAINFADYFIRGYEEGQKRKQRQEEIARQEAYRDRQLGLLQQKTRLGLEEKYTSSPKSDYAIEGFEETGVRSGDRGEIAPTGRYNFPKGAILGSKYTDLLGEEAADEVYVPRERPINKNFQSKTIDGKVYNFDPDSGEYVETGLTESGTPREAFLGVGYDEDSGKYFDKYGVDGQVTKRSNYRDKADSGGGEGDEGLGGRRLPPIEGRRVSDLQIAEDYLTQFYTDDDGNPIGKRAKDEIEVKNAKGESEDISYEDAKNIAKDKLSVAMFRENVPMEGEITNFIREQAGLTEGRWENKSPKTRRKEMMSALFRAKKQFDLDDQQMEILKKWINISNL